MLIQPIIAEVYDGRQLKRDVAGVIGLMIHRCGVDGQTGVVLGYDAVSICDHFTGADKTYPEVARATGSQNAYTFFIGGDFGPENLDGQIWQALPLTEIGHHARRFSRPYIGIGCIGDFRVGHGQPPSSRQWGSCLELCSLLCLYFRLQPTQVKGHGEVRGAHGGNKAPGRSAACPGDQFDVEQLRDEIAQRMVEQSASSARLRLAASGLVFD